MPTNIKYLVNQTNETIRFQRLEFIKAGFTLPPRSSLQIDTHIPWCHNHEEFAQQKYILISLLQSNRETMLWEAVHAIYSASSYSPQAPMVMGDTTTNKDKVLYVTPQGLRIENAGYGMLAADLVDREFEAQGEIGSIFSSNVAEGADELSMKSSGWCRVYVRRKSAAGAGHVGFAYAMPDGRWCVGGVENPGGGPIAGPGETGLWNKYVDPSEISSYFSHKHPMNYPYDAYKSVFVPNANFHAAQQKLATWYQNGYNLVNKNCSDAVRELLGAYGAVLPRKTILPNVWYDQIGARSQELRVLLNEDNIVADAVVSVAHTIADDPDRDQGEGLTILKPSEIDRSRGWFNAAALPVAGLPWPQVRKTSKATHRSGWSRVNINGSFAPDTYLLLHSFTGINITYPRRQLRDDGGAGANADPLSWITIMTGIVTFVKFLSDSIQHVFRTWVEFADWYTDQRTGDPGEVKDPARRVHLPEPRQDDAKRSVPSELTPRKPNDNGSYATDGSIMASELDILTTDDGRLTSRSVGRGMQIVLRYRGGNASSDHWVVVNDAIRDGMVRPESQLGAVPLIKLPNAENIEAIYIGWFEDAADVDAGKVSGGDMLGVLDFWQRT